MRISLQSLGLVFKKESIEVEFCDYNYFYGKIGAGKSTILRLVDYCLGGDSEYLMTPAMQQEFVRASLTLEIENKVVTLTRNKDSPDVAAEWSDGVDRIAILVPSRVSAGNVLEGTEVEVLSDLLFHLSGITPPKVRRNKTKEEAPLVRMSFRQLFWYCYLDQETIDSSFFNLDADANQYKREQSKNVLRVILGFHQERVAELEAKLTQAHDARKTAEASADSLKTVLSEVNVGSELEIEAVKKRARERLAEISRRIAETREEGLNAAEHAVETLRTAGRELSDEVESVVGALAKSGEIIEGNIRFKNELRSLRARMERTSSAMDILSGLDFEACPRCNQQLSEKDDQHCRLCGQAEDPTAKRSIEQEAASTDIKERIADLEGVIEERTQQRSRLERDLTKLRAEKQRIDREINEQLAQYDSAYLSAVLELEKESATVEERIRHLDEQLVLRQRVVELRDRASRLELTEKNLRKELKEERSKAEQDTKNIDRLKELFLDCLVRAQIPGIGRADTVEITSPNYLPEVLPHAGGGLVTSSFSNLGSGGKKTLFKCCFAVALHRLATQVGAYLPTLLILDSPMKNISERENKDEFAAFHKMLLELSQNELSTTQILIVDKELFEIPENYSRTKFTRHMDPNSTIDPPLIPYYRGP